MNHIPTGHADVPTVTVRQLLDVPGMFTTYGISERMTRRLVAERRIPFVKVGKHVRFRPEHIEAWLDENTVQAVAGTRAR